VPAKKAMGVCHFPTFHAAMDAAQHIVKLDPVAVELVDRTMIELARDIAIFRPTIEKVVRGEPDALLLVDFAEDDWDENLRRLKRLHEVIGDLGFDWSHAGQAFRRRGRGERSEAAGRSGRGQKVRPQHHDVHARRR
jgi:FAD/FMN-containing dehydrogenase